ncbi:MAG: hypothetical protein ACOX4T_10930 [Acetivibrionales bacterium]
MGKRHWLCGEEARLAYDEKVFSSRTTDLIAGGMDIVEDNGGILPSPSIKTLSISLRKAYSTQMVEFHLKVTILGQLETQPHG